MPPAVSVVIPTFNRSSRVVSAIESVSRQTYKDFEIVVVDDGSTDDTQEKLKRYAGRINYVYQENRGPSAAQNKGIAVASGTWVSILGDDDEWLPTKLEYQFEALARFPQDCAACFTNSQFIVDGVLRQTIFAESGFEPRERFGIFTDWLRHQVEGYPIIWMQSLMVRRSLLNEVGGFDESMGLNEDLDLIFRLALKTPLCFTSDPLVRIDRSLSQQRLTELTDFWNDAQYSSRAYMYAKWMGIPDLNPEVRARVNGMRRELLYDWMATKLREFRLSDAMEKGGHLREIGESPSSIVSELMMRAKRRIARFLDRENRAASQ